MAHILVVDDEEDLRALLKAALERDGHQVTALARGGAREIAELIQNLREPYGQVCRLCLLEERTPEEAALALGRPVKTIHTQLARGKQLLRTQLERSGSHGTI